MKETNEYEKTASYIAEIVKGLGLPECSVKTFADDEEIVFELDCGDDYGIVIGRRGETRRYTVPCKNGCKPRCFGL